MILKTIIVELISGVVFSFAGFLICLGIDYFIIKYFLGGGEAIIINYIIFFLPFVNILGILFVDKIYFKNLKWKIRGIICAILFNIIGLIVGYFIGSIFKNINFGDISLDRLFVIIFLPLLVVLFSVIGYNLEELKIFIMNHKVNNVSNDNAKCWKPK